MSQSHGVAVAMSPSDRERFWRRVLTTSTCAVWMGGVGADGYGRFWLSSGGTGRTVTPHQVVLALAGERVAAGATVLHDCDLRLCCRVGRGHVRVSTQSENMRQAVARGRARGPRPGWVDTRGPVGLSRAVQAALGASGDRTPDALARVLAGVVAAGDPLCGQFELFPVSTGAATHHAGRT